MNSTELKHTCPFCQYDMQAVTGANHDHKPKAGDFGLCMGCGEWLSFGKNLMPRKPTAKEYEIIVADPITGKMREAWVALKGAKPEAAPSDSDSILDKAFEVIETGLPELTNAPPQVASIMKTAFTLGARSVLKIIEKGQYEPNVAAEMLAEYHSNVTDYMMKQIEEGRKKGLVR